jgi:hypothetical protein
MEDNSEAHIKLDLKESIIKEALSSGVDLRVFSLEVERELKEVSQLCFFLFNLILNFVI